MTHTESRRLHNARRLAPARRSRMRRPAPSRDEPPHYIWLMDLVWADEFSEHEATPVAPLGGDKAR